MDVSGSRGIVEAINAGGAHRKIRSCPFATSDQMQALLTLSRERGWVKGMNDVIYTVLQISRMQCVSWIAAKFTCSPYKPLSSHLARIRVRSLFLIKINGKRKRASCDRLKPLNRDRRPLRTHVVATD